MDGSSSLAVSGVSDALANAAQASAIEGPLSSPVAAPVSSAVAANSAASEPASSPAALASPRSLDTLVEISPTSTPDLSSAKSEVLSGAAISSLPKGQLNNISILDVSVAQIAGLSSEELDELLPAT